jgi:hypothetical protein
MDPSMRNNSKAKEKVSFPNDFLINVQDRDWDEEFKAEFKILHCMVHE